MSQAAPRSLARTLTIKLVVVAGVFSTLLLAFFFTKYMLDTPALRRGALEAEQEAILSSLALHQDPAQRSLYRNYPRSYGFRVFEHRAGEPLRLVAEANPALLPEPFREQDASIRLSPSLAPGFEHAETADDGSGRDHWLLTDHVRAGKHAYLVQVTMEGDPAWCWVEAIADEMVDHVILPVLFIVPPLTLAIVLTTRRGLRPLDRIGLQAEVLGTAVQHGGRLTPLPQERLPLEFSRVVAAINTMLASLQRALEQQRQFTSDVAHELRTLLSVMLLELAELPAGPLAARLTSEIQELGALVNQLLNLAQAENMMQRERQRVELDAVVRRVCEDMAGAALSNHLMLDFNPSSERLSVRGNAALLDIAVRNLVDNAVKWSAQGTVVTVTVDGTGEGLGEVRVEDRGPGVPDTHKQRIFDRFWRAERQHTNGSGIGLALVRRIAQLHDGEVRVEDRDDGGARFVLSVPLASGGISADSCESVISSPKTGRFIDRVTSLLA